MHNCTRPQVWRTASHQHGMRMCSHADIHHGHSGGCACSIVQHHTMRPHPTSRKATSGGASTPSRVCSSSRLASSARICDARVTMVVVLLILIEFGFGVRWCRCKLGPYYARDLVTLPSKPRSLQGSAQLCTLPAAKHRTCGHATYIAMNPARRTANHSTCTTEALQYSMTADLCPDLVRVAPCALQQPGYILIHVCICLKDPVATTAWRSQYRRGHVGCAYQHAHGRNVQDWTVHSPCAHDAPCHAQTLPTSPDPLRFPLAASSLPLRCHVMDCICGAGPACYARGC